MGWGAVTPTLLTTCMRNRAGGRRQEEGCESGVMCRPGLAHWKTVDVNSEACGVHLCNQLECRTSHGRTQMAIDFEVASQDAAIGGTEVSAPSHPTRSHSPHS
jgi:hypothetical protein